MIEFGRQTARHSGHSPKQTNNKSCIDWTYTYMYQQARTPVVTFQWNPWRWWNFYNPIHIIDGKSPGTWDLESIWKRPESIWKRPVGLWPLWDALRFPGSRAFSIYDPHNKKSARILLRVIDKSLYTFWDWFPVMEDASSKQTQQPRWPQLVAAGRPAKKIQNIWKLRKILFLHL